MIKIFLVNGRVYKTVENPKNKDIVRCAPLRKLGAYLFFDVPVSVEFKSAVPFKDSTFIHITPIKRSSVIRYKGLKEVKVIRYFNPVSKTIHLPIEVDNLVYDSKRLVVAQKTQQEKIVDALNSKPSEEEMLEWLKNHSVGTEHWTFDEKVVGYEILDMCYNKSSLYNIYGKFNSQPILPMYYLKALGFTYPNEQRWLTEDIKTWSDLALELFS